ncbi:hypothetical protein [Mycobacteroides abscessus]|uniref:hypothetical protein n=1 Tax=Mycobacteroides abscessus TaxID=36809 RepID=UPI0009A66BDC|nr:hypothetical protein [Mycobacteroides abscessus]SKG49576.1 Uncharacterised protein [Mycobacteroides abscessus subsp. massiliense]SKH53089.1 Uncharacterised protein [Mycobacteroides abscessus subsp. massiliense]SKH96328.1 Uncharacterised protein [Mycobacteroides abscessus subsp. massiliense]SKI92699.1 Uncharacterised protein [Mycobacteroides abscessus subsp. massiliense]SKJ45730.1 Uncharacterised protein [Mycobacteroides abscessus subsp. massiliense]
MCQSRTGRVTVPNIGGPAAFRSALEAARNEAAARLGDNEQVIADSVRIDGSGSAHLDDDSLKVFHYTYTVATPGCPSWSTPT